MPETLEKNGFVEFSTQNLQLDYGSKLVSLGSHHDMFELLVSLAVCQVFLFAQLQPAFASLLCWPCQAEATTMN